eukprot:TRINITY_DN33088_c0_g1_i1.p1 TRINITY_DN33088_c0_g1~~TRINITY_DN33088_c0_g1_i1.p1  ORF type:complete len:697 (+),score=179.74 TRINITY_DN33088_c0_g1_i1:113-2092(+)
MAQGAEPARQRLVVTEVDVGDVDVGDVNVRKWVRDDVGRHPPPSTDAFRVPEWDAERLRGAMQQYFGFTEFRPHQLEVVQKALQGLDILAVMPAAHGKSLCYQLAALVSPHPVLVIQPSLSLLEDQVNTLRHIGIEAQFSGASGSAGHEDWSHLKLLFMTPESAVKQADRLAQTQFSLIVVDEAHCVHEMGRGFRPGYRKIGFLRDTHPSTPIMALTATAPPVVLEDVRATLRLREDATHTVAMKVDRPNLHYAVRTMDAFTTAAIHKIACEETCVMVFCMTNEECNMVYECLKHDGGVSVGRFHGGLAEGCRFHNHKSFMSGAVTVMVCTPSYGMGLDKQDIRHIIHYGFPRNLQEYYQQTSRAGRDGLRARCTMFAPTSIRRQASIIEPSGKVPKAEAVAYRVMSLHNVNDLVRYVDADPKVCRRVALMKHLHEEYTTPPEGCGACDHCDGALAHAVHEKVDITDIAKDLMGLVQHFAPYPHSLQALVRIYRGTGQKPPGTGGIKEYLRDRLDPFKRCPLYGAGRGHTWQFCAAVLQQLAGEGYLTGMLSYERRKKRTGKAKGEDTGVLWWGYRITKKGERMVAALRHPRAPRRLRVDPCGRLLQALGKAPAPDGRCPEHDLCFLPGVDDNEIFADSPKKQEPKAPRRKHCMKAAHA